MAKYEDNYDEKYDDELDYEGGEQQPDLDKKLKGYRIIIIALVAVLGLLTFQHFRVTSQIREDFRIERDIRKRRAGKRYFDALYGRI